MNDVEHIIGNLERLYEVDKPNSYKLRLLSDECIKCDTFKPKTVIVPKEDGVIMTCANMDACYRKSMDEMLKNLTEIKLI